jgi:putative membrane protein
MNAYRGLALLLLLFSCNNGSPDSVKNAKDSNAAKIDSQKTTERPTDSPAVVATKEDADFVVNAASGGMMEVQLGQIAQTNSTNQRVKAFGAMMVMDHSEGGVKLKDLASAKNITLPIVVSNRQQKVIEDLQKKKGGAFDRAYISSMVNDHKDDIKEFEKQAGKGTDAQIVAFANSNLEMLHRHLDSANSLRKQLGITDTKEILPPLK